MSAQVRRLETGYDPGLIDHDAVLRILMVTLLKETDEIARLREIALGALADMHDHLAKFEQVADFVRDTEKDIPPFDAPDMPTENPLR